MPNAILAIPCYDEAQRLEVARFEKFLREHGDVGFVLVDDGSRDGTLELLRAIERVAPERVEVLALPANVGKAEAVRAGVLAAFERRPAYVGYWDADLATPLEAALEFREILERKPELEWVMGARVVLLGRHIERRPLRHYLGRVAATIISMILDLRVYDTQCGAKLFRAIPEVRALFEAPFATSWLFDVEILSRRIRSAGGPEIVRQRVYEHPLTDWVDIAGSKLRPTDYLRAALDLLKV